MDARVEAFLQDLRDLSKKHNVFIQTDHTGLTALTIGQEAVVEGMYLDWVAEEDRYLADEPVTIAAEAEEADVSDAG